MLTSIDATEDDDAAYEPSLVMSGVSSVNPKWESGALILESISSSTLKCENEVIGVST